MRHIRTYRLFEHDHDAIRAELDRLGVKGYTIRPDGTVDVDDNVDLEAKGLTRLPVRFGRVGGSFECDGNRLETLEGAPEKVGTYFSCSDNRLTSLVGAPREVGGGFYCSGNLLMTLEGAPGEVGGGFFCSSNRLETLEGAPEKVGGAFYCKHNQLTSLEGGPQNVGEDFRCDGNPVPEGTLLRVFEVMQSEKVGYMEALKILHDTGELARLEGFEKLQGIEKFPDLRGRAMGSKFGI